VAALKQDLDFNISKLFSFFFFCSSRSTGSGACEREGEGEGLSQWLPGRARAGMALGWRYRRAAPGASA